MLVIALLVVAALPASATDSQQDACNGLRTALDVLESETKANPRAIENVTARAEAAGCIDTLYPASQAVCASLQGTFTPGGEWGSNQVLWTCANWLPEDRDDVAASDRLLMLACRGDIRALNVGVAPEDVVSGGFQTVGTTTSRCFLYPSS